MSLPEHEELGALRRAAAEVYAITKVDLDAGLADLEERLQRSPHRYRRRNRAYIGRRINRQPAEGWSPKDQKRQRLLAVLVGAATVVATAVAAALLAGANGTPHGALAEARYPSGSSRPATVAPTSPAALQVAAIDALVTGLTPTRQLFAVAQQQISSCRELPSATANLRTVIEVRKNQLERVRALEVTMLPEGERLRASLYEALAQSLEADRSYLRWAEAILTGPCPAEGSKFRNDARIKSKRAWDAGRKFLTEWQPVAIGFGLPVHTRCCM